MSKKSTADVMQEVANEWMAARNVIRDYLCELLPGVSSKAVETTAASIIARLAQHDPPILLKMEKKGRRK